MNATPTNAPAFPCPDNCDAAGMAMQGMLSCQDFMNDLCKLKSDRADARQELARLAFAQADAMLAEAKKTGGAA